VIAAGTHKRWWSDAFASHAGYPHHTQVFHISGYPNHPSKGTRPIDSKLAAPAEESGSISL